MTATFMVMASHSAPEASGQFATVEDAQLVRLETPFPVTKKKSAVKSKTT